MKMLKTIAASAAMAAAMMGAGAASAATIYDLNTYASTSGITGSSLGTVTVGGQGTNVLSFDVLLNSNVFFQMTGSFAVYVISVLPLTVFFTMLVISALSTRPTAV